MYSDIVNNGIVTFYGNLRVSKLGIVAATEWVCSEAYVLETDVIERFGKMQEIVRDVI